MIQKGQTLSTHPLEAKLKASEEKIMQLQAENDTLNKEITRLNDEIEIQRKIIENLKEKTTAEPLSFFRMKSANDFMSNQRLSKVSDFDEPIMLDPMRFTNTRYTISKGLSRGGSVISGLDASPEREGATPGIESEADFPQDEFEEAVFAVSKDKEKFYEYNDMHKYLEAGPLNWQLLQTNEKKFDLVETIFKKWADFLKEFSKAGQVHTKAVDNFSNQLLSDKESFKQNKEIYHLLHSFAQFLKEYNTYFEIFLKIVTDSVQIPLRNFSKKDSPLYKDIKKKLAKAHEEMEAAETKYMSIKKSAAQKDPYGYQTSQKAYFVAAKAYENVWLDYIQGINSLNLSVNLEMVDKFSALFTGEMAFFHAGSMLLMNIERKLDFLIDGSHKKNAHLEELNNELRSIKELIEKKFQTSAINLNKYQHEGFLFMKKENKGMLKRYFSIKENGVMSMIKKRDQQAAVIVPDELLNLKLCSVKESFDADYPYCFEMVSMQNKKHYVFQTHSESELKQWISTIKNITENLIYSDFNSAALPNSGGKSDSKERSAKEQKITQATKKNICADCGANEPSWISLNLLVIVCLDCSGVHRKLGPSVSKMRSLKLDNINDTLIEIFLRFDTEKINRVWEAQTSAYKTIKPKPDSSNFEKERWIRMKYVDRVF